MIKKGRKFFVYVTVIFVLAFMVNLSLSFAQEEPRPELAGELFQTPVPSGNYYFAKRVVANFSAKWRVPPQGPEELEDLVWQELVLSFEAFKRDVTVTKEEINEEIVKMLKNDKAEFDHTQDIEAYQEWVKLKLDEPVEVFENQLEHLIKLEKLRQEVLDSITPEVTKKEAHRKFLDEYNTLSVELLRFDDLEEAKAFYKQVKVDSQAWEKRKEEIPGEFKRPGFVALDFLIHMWKFDRKDAYKMLKKKVDSFYPPAPIYKGYAVFKILKIRTANKEEFSKRRDYYFDKMTMIKKHQGFKDWLQDLKEEANIKVFIE